MWQEVHNRQLEDGGDHCITLVRITRMIKPKFPNGLVIQSNYLFLCCVPHVRYLACFNFLSFEWEFRKKHSITGQVPLYKEAAIRKPNPSLFCKASFLNATSPLESLAIPKADLLAGNSSSLYRSLIWFNADMILELGRTHSAPFHVDLWCVPKVLESVNLFRTICSRKCQNVKRVSTYSSNQM